jgi:hypothetical protein
LSAPYIALTRPAQHLWAAALAVERSLPTRKAEAREAQAATDAVAAQQARPCK